MAQPTAYSKTTSFAQDESNNVGGRAMVRTSNLDSEFVNIETTLRQTLSNLSLIQRDDGQLRDSIVQLYHLSSICRLALQADMNPRGPWQTFTSYAASDLVEVAGDSYICVTAHTSGTFLTDYAAGLWQILVSSGAVNLTDYTALRAYAGESVGVHITDPDRLGIAGSFTRDDDDTTSADNGGTIIVTSAGKRWKRTNTNGLFNIQWFGAKADSGTTNNFTAIQNALTACGAAGGGVVWVPPATGYYKLDTGATPLVIENDGVNLEGAGYASRIHIVNWNTNLTASTLSVQTHILMRKSGGVLRNCSIRRIQFSSTYDYEVDQFWYLAGGGSFPWGCIQMAGYGAGETTYNCGVEYCVFRNTGGSAFGAGGGTTAADDDETTTNSHGVYFRFNDIDNTIFSGCDIFSGGIEDADISNNKIKRCSGGGILMPGMGGIIANNDISHTKNYGLSVSGYPTKDRWTQVLGNHLFRCGSGTAALERGVSMYFGDSVAMDNRITVKGNVIKDSYGPGIWCVGGAAEDMEIDSNVIDGFGYLSDGYTTGALPGGEFVGINTPVTKRVTITNNTVIACSGAGHKSNTGFKSGAGEYLLFQNNRARGTFLVRDFAVNFSGGRNGAGTNCIDGGGNINVTTGKMMELLDGINNPNGMPWTVDLDTTPSVKNIPNGGAILLNDSAPIIITNLDDGYDGQRITLIGNNGNTTINNGGSFVMAGGNWVSALGKTLSLMRQFGGTWYETGRT
jgi:hypothetical protein